MQATALKQVLEMRGLDVFLCEVAPGGNIKKVIVKAIDEAKMVIVLGTRTYGMETESSFSTFNEMEFFVAEQKPFFLLKMCHRFAEAVTRFNFANTVSYYEWLPEGDRGQGSNDAVPADLVTQIIKKCSDIASNPPGC